MPHDGHLFPLSLFHNQFCSVQLLARVRIHLEERVDGSHTHGRLQDAGRIRQPGQVLCAFFDEAAGFLHHRRFLSKGIFRKGCRQPAVAAQDRGVKHPLADILNLRIHIQPGDQIIEDL